MAEGKEPGENEGLKMQQGKRQLLKLSSRAAGGASIKNHRIRSLGTGEEHPIYPVPLRVEADYGGRADKFTVMMDGGWKLEYFTFDGLIFFF